MLGSPFERGGGGGMYARRLGQYPRLTYVRWGAVSRLPAGEQQLGGSKSRDDASQQTRGMC